MPTPTMSVRANPTVQGVIRAVAQALRHRPELAGAIRAAIAAADDAKMAVPRSPVRPNSGPFRSEAEALATLLARLVSELAPEEVHLFGSRGRGAARPDSDFDLLLVLPDDWNGAEPLDYDAAYRPVRGLGVGVDVVPYPRSLFEKERGEAGTLAHEATHYGRRVYPAPTA